MTQRRPLHIDVAIGALVETATPDSVLLDIGDFTELASAPASPPAGFIRVYAKTDHKLYRKDSGGTETELGAGGGGGGAINVRALVTAGFAFSTVNTSSPAKPAVAPGFAFDASRIRGVVDVKPAFAFSQLVSGTQALPALSSGFAFSPVVTLSPSSTPFAVGFDLQRAQFDLTHRRGGSSRAGTGSAWTNPANSISGTDAKHDTSNATIAGSATGAIDGTLTLSYPAQPNRTDLVISSVKLYFYVAQTGTLANNGGLDLSYNLGGSDTLLQSFTADQASLTTPLVYDITAAVAGDWTNVAALNTKTRFHVALGAALVNASLDAVEAEVLAAYTWNL